MKKAVRSVCAFCTALCIAAFSGITLADSNTASEYTTAVGEAFRLPADGLLTVNKTTSLAADSTSATKYTATVNLLGILPVKEISVKEQKRETVIPCGNPFGIKIFTDGVMVIGLAPVQTDDKTVNPAKNAGLSPGDVIISINGESVYSNDDVAGIIEESGGDTLNFKISRNDKRFDIPFVPAKSVDGSYRAGMWVRDSTAGIGTLTYYDPDSMLFAGLGHAVCDTDTGETLPLKSGEIVPSRVTGVTKGVSGNPGELQGFFMADSAMGDILLNSDRGVFGYLQPNAVTVSGGEETEIAYKQEITEGAAEIITTIDGETPQTFSCVIEKIDMSGDNPTKNMVVLITDRELIEATGGIVQGMSGSPIIQNNRLIGAVTHVFVNDPQRGYAVFAENMQDAAEELS